MQQRRHCLRVRRRKKGQTAVFFSMYPCIHLCHLHAHPSIYLSIYPICVDHPSSHSHSHHPSILSIHFIITITSNHPSILSLILPFHQPFITAIHVIHPSIPPSFHPIVLTSGDIVALQKRRWMYPTYIWGKQGFIMSSVTRMPKPNNGLAKS